MKSMYSVHCTHRIKKSCQYVFNLICLACFACNMLCMQHVLSVNKWILLPMVYPDINYHLQLNLLCKIIDFQYNQVREALFLVHLHLHWLFLYFHNLDYHLEMSIFEMDQYRYTWQDWGTGLFELYTDGLVVSTVAKKYYAIVVCYVIFIHLSLW